MFRRQISIQQQRQASGKDTKQLRRDLQLQFSALDEAALSELLPAKAQVLTMKLSNRSIAHSVDGSVLFFDPYGRGDMLVPTVYALWKFPDLLPALHTHSPVSTKIIGGADLFLQGVVVEDGMLPHFAEGDLLAIKVAGNPFPFAVGTTEVSSEQAARAGMKGKGVKLVHQYRDQLWGLGEKLSPDPSFTPTCVLPQEARDSEAPVSEVPPAKAAILARIEKLGMAEEQEDSLGAAPKTDHTARIDAEDVAANDGLESNSRWSGPTHDEIFESSLLQGLQTLKEQELPIMTSDFYTKHMLPAKPEGAVFEIKRTSYKKLSKLLQRYEKEGLIKLKVDFKKDYLSAVDRKHQLFGDGRQKHREMVAQQASGSGQEAEPRFQLSYLYRFPSSLRAILGVTPPSKDTLFSEEEVLAALQQYAESFQLCQAAGLVKLNRLLVANLFNKKEFVIEGNPHPLTDLQKRLLGKLQQFHKAVRISEQGERVESVRKGSIKNIEVKMDDKFGGRKHATKLSHLESFALNPEDLAGTLQKQFQTSCSIQKLPGKVETGQELVLQGDMLQAVVKLLSTTYGVETKYITSINKGRG